MIKVLDSHATSAALPMLALVDQMESLFLNEQKAPDRHHHTLPMVGEPDATLLLMPVWDERIGCVKVVNVVPGNSARGHPAISGNVLVFNRQCGAPLALLDGAAMTARRTAAASALGARYLAREDVKTLLIVGAGRVAAQLAEAFSAVRPSLSEVLIWNVNPASAQKLAASLQSEPFTVRAVDDLTQAVQAADIISCATLAREPLIDGHWLQPGQHLDLIGAFTPEMREADDEVMRRGEIFIDTEFALTEAGELRTPIEKGVISKRDIKGDLYDITAKRAGRNASQDITVFKSVGNAVMDLAAASVAIPSTQ